eukprot:1107401-Pyramimonas_sp.AAC.1
MVSGLRTGPNGRGISPQAFAPFCQAPDSVGHRLFCRQHPDAVDARQAADVSASSLERAQNGDA